MAVWIAAITLLSVPAPFWSKTRRLMMFAFGAIPLNVCVKLEPVENQPAPAMIPDMCSVAILVGAIRCARNKVLAIDNARAISLIRRNPPIEITNGGDAAINDRYSDARAIQTPPLPRDGCIDLFLRRSRESKYR